VKPKKKRRAIRKTFVYSTLLVLTAYGAGTAAAVNNERIHDYFLENVPLGEQILDFAESKGYVGGLPRPIADPGSSARRRRPTPSSAPSADPPKKKEKIEAFKSRVEEKVKEKKERIRTVAAQLQTTTEKGLPHDPIPTHISAHPAAPLPPKSYSEGVEDLVREVKSVLKGDPIPLAEDRHEQEAIRATAAEPEKQAGPAHTEPPAAPAAPMKEGETPEAPQGKKWYTTAQLPLGFEPPPGYTVPPPKVVPKTTAGLLLVAPAVAEFTASEPLLNELATMVDNLAKYLEDNPKAERSVNKILDVAKKDLADLGSKIESVKKESKEKLETSLEEAARSYSVKLLEAELNARDKLDAQDEEWRHYFEQERLSLLQKYQEKLDNELATQNDLINERYVSTLGESLQGNSSLSAG
jgi:mitofilin